MTSFRVLLKFAIYVKLIAMQKLGSVSYILIISFHVLDFFCILINFPSMTSANHHKCSNAFLGTLEYDRRLALHNGIPLGLNLDLAKSRLPITYFSIIQSF